MSIPARALELENQYVESSEPTLFAAFEVIRDHWRSGHRERETALHLVFLDWFMLVEEWQVGYERNYDEENDAELGSLIYEAHDYLNPAQSEDAELLYVFGVMADIAPWELGDFYLWKRRAEEFLAKSRQLQPDGLDPEIFGGRGAFGDYFAGHTRAYRYRTAANSAMNTDGFLRDLESEHNDAVCFARCHHGALVDLGVQSSSRGSVALVNSVFQAGREGYRSGIPL